MSDTWITEDSQTYALVGAELDRWRRAGWAVVDEPPAGAWVYHWHEGIAEPGRVPLAAQREFWSRRGWVAGPPPGGWHPAEPQPSAEPAETKPSKSAAGGAKEKVTDDD